MRSSHLAAAALATDTVDPSTIPLRELARIRGAMWTVKGNYPLGPRPNQDDNIFAPDYFEQYGPTYQQKGLGAFRSRGYRNAPHGPIVAAGYRGDFADEDWRGNFDGYLDSTEQMWAGGVRPVEFLKPDGWTLDQLKTLEPLFRSPRCQRLFRIVVDGGWEPWMTNAEWVAIYEWGRAVFPNALHCLHMPPDHDAPGLSSEPIGGDEMWRRVIRYVHVWLVQNGAFGGGPTGPNFENFKAQFSPAVRGSLYDRLHNGYAGWPTFSAWGEAEPIVITAAEFASYWVYHDNRPESQAMDWGDAAIASGADGYLDGGRVEVP